MGRRKIEIKKIDNKAYLKATFSKRRKGLFRKAAELCHMCGAEIAILTVSPGGKFYNFGHPNVDSIVARYCGDDGALCAVDETHGNPNVESVVARSSGDRTLSTIHENNDRDVRHEDDDDDDEGLEVEHEKEDGSSDEVDEDEDMDGRSLSMAGEEKEPIDESSLGISDKFWWDEDEPVDPEQRRMYICSLQELRNNVQWLLNDRKMRESYVKDYISGI